MSRILDKLKERGLLRLAVKCDCGATVIRDLSLYPEFRLACDEAESDLLKEAANGRRLD